MSAPDTNVEKQAKRHRPALFGLIGAVGLAAILFLVFLAWISLSGDAPEGADVQINGITGEAEVSN